LLKNLLPRNPPPKSGLPLASDPPPNDWVALAEVGAPIGLKGAVRLHTLKSVTGLPIDDTLLAESKDCWLKLRHSPPSQASASTSLWLRCNILECSPQTRGVKLMLEEITDRNQAELLRGASVGLSRSSFPELSDNESYWADLIGCRVVNRQGEDFGLVQSLQTNGEHDWLVVDQGWIPFVGQYIDEVDESGRLIRVDWLIDWFE
jgi:16S rRNA processing protein RimM